MNQLTIESITARRILDSRGYPTVEVTLRADGRIHVAAAPSGASTGEHEAVELRDGGTAFGGRGVDQAIGSVDGEIAALLTGRAWTSLADLDEALIAADGTGQLARLGANAVVATSMAAARAFAAAAGQELHAWIAQTTGSTELMPVPHFNVLNGGAHAVNDLDFQEFMIAPGGAATETDALEWGAEVYHALAKLIASRYGTAGLGDEGGFAPPIADPRQALDLLVEAITTTGHRPALDDVAIALDPAANGFLQVDSRYSVAGRMLDRDALTEYYSELIDEYPIRSIEDGFAEDDRDGWAHSYPRLHERVQLVGDDLFVTDAQRITDGATSHLANAALIKPNQIGTVTGTFDAIAAARTEGMACMISHRSGETGDTFIADLAVGTGVGQIKSGAPARGERVAKYNRMTQIEADHPELAYGLEVRA